MAGRRFSFDVLLGRFRILMILPALVFGGIFIRLIALQVVRGEEYRQQAEENRIRPEILRAHRGRLLDRQGRVLADNAPSFQLSLDPRARAFRRDRAAMEGAVQELARLLDRDPVALLADVERARRSALPPITLARNLTFATLSAIEERMENLPGVEVRAEPARRYPYGTLAAHLIGYLGEVSEDELQAGDPARPYRRGDLIGRSGVERSYEEYLRGTDGVEYVQVDALGRRADIFEELPTTPSQPGNDVVLTIDLGVQRAAEAALDSVPSLQPEKLGEVSPPRRGAIVALDPRTGEILAMASRPAFDPNLFVGGLSKEDWRILSGAGFPLLNRAIQAAYPPGSTFKIITALAGLHEGVIDPFTPMPAACRGGYPFGNRVFHCHKKEGHGSLVLRDAIARSCDVYFYQVGLRLGVDRLTQYAVSCSVGAPTRVDLPQERGGLIPTIDWFRSARGGPPGGGAALNLAIGQGELLLTPIELARLAAAVANGGTLVHPHVLRSVLDRDGNGMNIAGRAEPAITRLPATDAELMAVRDGLEAVVMDPSGTGKRARVEPYTAAGKTGTAQNPHGEDHALFICYAPAESPEIVVAVVLEESGGGGAMAAPAARRVLDAYLNPGPVPLANGNEGGR